MEEVSLGDGRWEEGTKGRKKDDGVLPGLSFNQPCNKQLLGAREELKIVSSKMEE